MGSVNTRKYNIKRKGMDQFWTCSYLTFLEMIEKIEHITFSESVTEKPIWREKADKKI